jgi:hypothetical protein
VQAATLLSVAQDQGHLQLSPGKILHNCDTVGRIIKWSFELSEFKLEFCPRQAIKSQILTDFVFEWTDTQQPPPTEKPEHWKMYFDGSQTSKEQA